MDDARDIARIFKVLSVDTRVRIVGLLKSDVLCVGALADRLDVSPPAVSQHLRVLRDADVVVSEKRGNYVHYRVNEETLARWQRMASDFLTIEH
jgi:DNA-binding transcriptional ArsR family regulator